MFIVGDALHVTCSICCMNSVPTQLHRSAITQTTGLYTSTSSICHLSQQNSQTTNYMSTSMSPWVHVHFPFGTCTCTT